MALLILKDESGTDYIDMSKAERVTFYPDGGGGVIKLVSGDLRQFEEKMTSSVLDALRNSQPKS
jgi:hypothetical protein